MRVRITEVAVPQRSDGPEWVIPDEEVSLVQEQLEEIEAATPSRFKTGSPAHLHMWDQVSGGAPAWAKEGKCRSGPDKTPCEECLKVMAVYAASPRVPNTKVQSSRPQQRESPELRLGSSP